MKKGLYILSCLILIIIGMVTIIHSSYFAVKKVKISGIYQLTEKDILTALPKLEGQNIFLVPGREMVSKLLSFDRIKGAKLERNLPHTLVIKINERCGLGLFKDTNNNWIEVSEDGRILNIYSNDSLPELPIIQGYTVVSMGDKVEIRDDLSTFLKILASFLPMQSKMTSVSYNPQDIRITFETKTVLFFGQAVNSQKKIEIFTSLWEELDFNLKKVEYIDLRYEGNPVIRFFDGQKG